MVCMIQEWDSFCNDRAPFQNAFGCIHVHTCTSASTYGKSTRACAHTRTRTCTHTRTRTYAQTHSYAQAHAGTCTRTCTCTCAHTHVHTHVHANARTPTRMPACMCTCAHMHACMQCSVHTNLHLCAHIETRILARSCGRAHVREDLLDRSMPYASDAGKVGPISCPCNCVPLLWPANPARAQRTPCSSGQASKS